MSEVFILEKNCTKEEFIRHAVDLLTKNKIISLLSDTIFGILASYSIENAEKLRRIKGRTEEKPFLVVIPENYELQWLADLTDIQPLQKDFMAKKWPGRHTFILPRQKKAVYPDGPTIAIRKPCKTDNPVFHAILQQAGPLLAPSLNKTSEPVLDNLKDMIDSFGGILDGIFFQESIHHTAASHIWDLTGADIIRIR